MDQKSIANGTKHWNNALLHATMWGSVLYALDFDVVKGLSNAGEMAAAGTLGTMNIVIRMASMKASDLLLNVIPSRDKETGKLHYPDQRPLSWKTLVMGTCLTLGGMMSLDSTVEQKLMPPVKTYTNLVANFLENATDSLRGNWLEKRHYPGYKNQ